MSRLLRFLGVLSWITILSGALAGAALAADAVPITILHTNDLHSHLRPEKTPLGLGGIARMKTAIDRLRRSAANTLLVDGGDWSDGDIYYTEGEGRETLKLMDLMGYDIAVVGNHDWLNGPDTLLNAVDQAQPHFSMIAANFDTSAYRRGSEFRKVVQPYVIKEIQGVKIAFIGLATYEFIYDKYIAPIKITEPFGLTHDLAKKLKQYVDAVVVISHNRISYNKALLQAAPDVDLVIGAHDHVKLPTPIVVSRLGAKPGWIVETGCWGRYLGRVDMRVTPRMGNAPADVQLLHYGLTQIDRTIPENPAIAARVDALEQAIVHRMGPVFTDHIADADMELTREGTESPLGDFLTDSYRNATGADLALDVRNFVYGSIHEGPVDTVDVYNMNPAIYNPSTGKSWTLKTLPVKGSTLGWIFKLLLFKNIPVAGTIYTSGAQILFDGTPKPALPLNGLPPGDPLAPESLNSAPFPKLGGQRFAFFGSGDDGGDNPTDPNSTIRRILIRGQPLDESAEYLLTGGGGIFETIETLNSMIPGIIPLDGLKDTGIEAWRATADYIRAETPVTPSKVAMGQRIQTLQADLGMYYDDVTWAPLREQGPVVQARVTVTVHNFGASASPATGPYLVIAKNQNGSDLGRPTNNKTVTELPIDPLQPGESRKYDVNVTLTPDRGVYSITALVRGNGFEANHGNDDVIRYFTLPGRR